MGGKPERSSTVILRGCPVSGQFPISKYYVRRMDWSLDQTYRRSRNRRPEIHSTVESASSSLIVNRQFRRYWAATTISGFGDWVSIVALSFALLHVSGVVLLGAALLVRQGAVVLMLLAGGIFADRFQRWILIEISYAARALCQVAVALVLLYLHELVVLILVFQFVNGVATAFSRPATSGLIPELVPNRSQLQQANSLLALSRSSVSLLGAAGGAVLVVALSAPIGLLVDGITFALAFVLSWRLGASAARTSIRRASPLADVGQGLRIAAGLRWFLPVVGTFALSNLLFTPAMAVLGPSISLSKYGGAAGWSVVLICEAVGGIVGALVGSRAHFRRPLVLSVAVSFLAALEMLSLGLNASLVLLSVFAFIAGMCLTLGDALWHGVLQSSVDATVLGRLSSIDWLGSVALAPLGYALVPVLSSATSPQSVLVTSAGIMAACSTLVLLFVLFARPDAATRSQTGNI
jgi:hypothetical protein